MKLQTSDLLGRIHKETLLEKIKSDTSNLNQLALWSIRSEQPLGWRATWLLRQVIPDNSPELQPVIGKALTIFLSFSDSQKREWLKLLTDQSLTSDQQGILLDICIAEWCKLSNHSALRASAISHVLHAVRKYPELKNEISLYFTSEYLNTLTPGIKKGVLKSWEMLKIDIP